MGESKTCKTLSDSGSVAFNEGGVLVLDYLFGKTQRYKCIPYLYTILINGQWHVRSVDEQAELNSIPMAIDCSIDRSGFIFRWAQGKVLH